MIKRLALVLLLTAACAGTPTPTPTLTPALKALPTHPPPTPAANPSALPAVTLAPAPTAGAAATPAPIPYVVQSGDTFIGIAVQHNVTLEALQALNAGLDPANLKPGQTILLPPEAANTAPAPTGPLAVSVPPFACRPTPVASLLCLTEFVNTTAQPVANLSVKATLESGESAVAYSPLDVIPPGSAAPLAAVFAAGSAATATATMLTADPGGGLAARFVWLAVSEVTGAPAAAGFTLSGAVTNPAASAVRSVTVVATLYNAAGQVTDYRAVILTGSLEGTASQSFSVALPGVNNAARWAVVAQGRAP